jgi:hypothetical protein
VRNCTAAGLQPQPLAWLGARPPIEKGACADITGLNCKDEWDAWSVRPDLCYRGTMNAPDINRAILRMHIAAIEAKYPMRIVGLLPRGSVGHVFADNALDFLAEKKPGLDLWGLAAAEVELGELLGRPVGVVLRSGLKGHEAEEFPRLVEAI